MTPSRIPPPFRDGIPKPVASPDAPPPVEIEVTAVTEFGDTPTHVEPRRCPGCAGPFIELDGDGWIPVTYEEAWGKYEGACRGSRDPSGAWWCQAPAEPLAKEGGGRLVIPHKMEVKFFPDRRQQEAPVVIERRKGA